MAARFAFSVVISVVLTYAVSLPALAQMTRAEAFAQGKEYKAENAKIKDKINAETLEAVPGQDAGKRSELEGLYGSKMDEAGTAKVAECAGYVPGKDAYKNQECETVNYVSRNPVSRPKYTIEGKTDPTIRRGETIRKSPEAHTGGMGGLAGTYTGCSVKTTTYPPVTDLERCEVGRNVSDASCESVLKVTYTLVTYAGQAGADLRYGTCPAGEVRGDLVPGAALAADSCYMLPMTFTRKVTVPVFVDRWDDSACDAVKASAADIKN